MEGTAEVPISIPRRHQKLLAVSFRRGIDPGAYHLFRTSCCLHPDVTRKSQYSSLHRSLCTGTQCLIDLSGSQTAHKRLCRCSIVSDDFLNLERSQNCWWIGGLASTWGHSAGINQSWTAHIARVSILTLRGSCYHHLNYWTNV